MTRPNDPQSPTQSAAALAEELRRVANLKMDLDVNPGGVETMRTCADLISSQSREIERLRAFAQGFIDRAPKEEPDRYEGDNHGDSETNACDRMSWHLAKAARAAIGGSS